MSGQNSRSGLSVASVALLLLSVMVGNAWGSPAYTITDLFGIPDYYNVYPYGINDSGQVTGYCQNSSGDTRAFLWQANTGMQDLGPAISKGYSLAYGISNNGNVVGNSANGPFLWHSGSATQFIHGDASGGDAYAVNDSGQVAGVSNNLAYVWQSGSGMQMLGNLGGSMSYARTINATGQVAGQATLSGNTTWHAFLWQNSGGMQDLGTLPGGSQSFAFGINNKTQVVGQAVAANGNYDAFLWQAGSGMQDLGALGGFTSAAYGINDAGQVVGWAKNGGDQAFVWQSGLGMRNLNSLIPPWSEWELRVATAINNKGQIIGYGMNPSGDPRAFLLTPVAVPNLPGDANLDGIVDFNDLSRVLTNYDKTGMVWAQGDFNGDGRVDLNDLSKVLTNYDKTAAAGAGGSVAAAPEPSVAVLLGVVVASLLAGVWRRGLA